MKTKRRLGRYLLLAFVIPLVCIGMIRWVPGCGDGVPSLLIYGVEAASPTIAAILVWLIAGGRRELVGELKNKYVKGLSIRYVFFAAFMQIMILTIARGVVIVLNEGEPFAVSLTNSKIIIVGWALVAEELGWRGLLQGELESVLPDWLIPIVTGSIWACWHYHFFIGQTMAVPMLAFVIGCILESYAYYAITKASEGNIIPACIWHFTGNLFFNLYQFAPTWNQGDTKPYWIATCMYGLCIPIYIIVRKKNKKRQ